MKFWADNWADNWTGPIMNLRPETRMAQCCNGEDINGVMKENLCKIPILSFVTTIQVEMVMR